MPTIYIDESGYTGEDLFNAEQPIFVLASLKLSEEESSFLKAAFFGTVRADELKFSRLRSTGSRQSMVLEFLHSIAHHVDVLRLTVIHKRYALVAKIVDLVVEPSDQAMGHNILYRGENIALANLLYTALPVLIGRSEFLRLLETFQRMVRVPTVDTIAAFIGEVHRPRSSAEAESAMDRIRVGIPYIHDWVTLDLRPLDVTTTSLISLVSDWRDGLDAPMDLIHDESSQMAADRWLWDSLTDPVQIPYEIGLDRRRMSLPLPVQSTSSESSHNWVGLQLADICSGAAARAFRWLDEGRSAADGFSAELADLFLETHVSNALWPTAMIDPRELGTDG